MAGSRGREPHRRGLLAPAGVPDQPRLPGGPPGTLLPGGRGGPQAGVGVGGAGRVGGELEAAPRWPGSLTIPALWLPLVSKKVSSVSAITLSL